MKIRTRLKEISKLRDKKVRRADKATEKTLNHFGAIIRQDARKLIGAPARGPKFTFKVIDGRRQMLVTPGPKPRPAGSPPKARRSQEGANLRTIVFKAELDKARVRIGSLKLSGGRTYGGKTIPEIQEFGAIVAIRAIRVQSALTKANIKKRKGQLTQVSSSLKLVETDKGRPMVVKMPKRPYLQPAYDKHKKNATRFWKAYYQASKGR